jgi:hypothetical protein
VGTGHMPDWIHTRPEDAWKVPSDEVLRKLADGAGIPDAARENFEYAVCGTVEAVWIRHEQFKTRSATKRGGTLDRVALAAVTLHESLNKLKKDDHKHLQDIFPALSDERLRELRQSAYRLADIFTAAMGKPPPRSLDEIPRRGRKLGAVKDVSFRRFVCDLLLDAKASGGILTLEKHDPPTGSLIRALKLLAPHLPDGFVPNAPSGTTLQRLKRWSSQIEVASDDLPEDFGPDDLWMYSLYPRRPT